LLKQDAAAPRRPQFAIGHRFRPIGQMGIGLVRDGNVDFGIAATTSHEG
jgi:hypothetical protein